MEKIKANFEPSALDLDEIRNIFPNNMAQEKFCRIILKYLQENKKSWDAPIKMAELVVIHQKFNSNNQVAAYSLSQINELFCKGYFIWNEHKYDDFKITQEFVDLLAKLCEQNHK